MRAGSLQAQFTPIVSILVVLSTALIIGVGGYVAASNTVSLGFFNISAGSVDIGTLILFLVYVKMLYQPMRDLSKLANLSSSAGSGAERIQEVLDQAPEVIERQPLTMDRKSCRATSPLRMSSSVIHQNGPY